MNPALTLTALLCLGLLPFTTHPGMDAILVLMTIVLMVVVLNRYRKSVLISLMILTAAPVIPFVKWFEPAIVRQSTDVAFRSLNSELDIAEGIINQFFLNNAAALDSIAILISQSTDLTDEQYQQWLAQILPAYRNQFLNIALSENLIIEHVYPPNEANLNVLGADQSQIPNQGVQYRNANQTRQPIVIGPVTLLQGVPGVIYVRPISEKPGVILAGVLSLDSLKSDLNIVLSDSIQLQIDINTLLSGHRLIDDAEFDNGQATVRELDFQEVRVRLAASSEEVNRIASRTRSITRLTAGAFWLTLSLILSWQHMNYRFRERQRQALLKSEHELISAQRLGQMGSWNCRDGQVLSLSPPLQELLSVNSDRLSLDALLERLHPEQSETHARRIRNFMINQDDHLTLEHKLKASNRYQWFEHRLAREADNQITGILRNIQSLRERDEQVAKLESFDSLTGAANRHYFGQITEQNLALCERRRTTLVLVLINVDDFRDVNKTYGQTVGDELLKQITARLHANSRKSDTVARLSGDTFAMSLVDVGTSRQSVFIVEQIMRRLKDPYAVAEDLYPQFTLGVAMYPDDATDYDTLLRMAESALSAAKQESRGHYRYYSAELSEQTDRRQKILAALPGAIANDHLHLVFQPRVSSENAAVITSMEALVRWHDPILGDVSPGEFIPIAEHTSLISDIGQWVMKQSFKTVAEYQNMLEPGMTLSINLSPRQLEDPNLPKIIRNLLHDYGLPASRFELEITEHSIAEQSTDILDNMHELNEMGFQFALDDFGTGYSNLGILQALPLNILKIDMSFVRAIGTSDRSDELVRAIINMGHTLGLKVVAEGVESAAQVQFLKEQNCEELQGFYFFRPASIDDVILAMRG